MSFRPKPLFPLSFSLQGAVMGERNTCKKIKRMEKQQILIDVVYCYLASNGRKASDMIVMMMAFIMLGTQNYEYLLLAFVLILVLVFNKFDFDRQNNSSRFSFESSE
jgi:hypothetical protein